MKKVFAIVILAVVAFACSSNDNEGVNNSQNYDRTAILTNWADNIIIPAYQNYNDKVSELYTKTTDFTQNPDETKLNELRTAWLSAYEAYQYVAMYDFGKASILYLKQSANTYPTDVAGIENNITTGSYNLDTQIQFSRQGFPGIDYLINGLGDDAETVAYYSNTAAADYLTAITAQLKSIAEQVTNDWNGTYRNTFVNNNGTSVTSSVNVTTNNFVRNFEKDVRSGKVGIPAGIFSNGITYADKVEAYYKNNVSKMLLNAGIKAQQDFFNGKAFNSTATGPSLKSALDGVNAVRNGENLSTIINNQFAAIYTANNQLSESLSQQVTTDNNKMLNAYDAMQQNVIYIKLDMMQALNITIDYVDGDGD
ncbi:imelysin family protein [Flavobacterium alkalisoli]|uniref:Imelysin family protein n=1 Tax=Flavobacterium alkalisoli TaxID=2602769 RepID=A0A5B9FY59_9FLAO|nr:imelysin family protein [Flavobacterium alkalisoli]QEE49802.1 imelysin family protein [Flavobacterium alkalisoli]